MKDDFARSLAPALRKAAEGRYAKGYAMKGIIRETALQDLLARLLDGLGIGFREKVPIGPSGRAVADFLVGKTYVFVGRQPGRAVAKQISEAGGRCLLITRESMRSDRSDPGIRIVSIGAEPRSQTIFMDDPSFAFDYAHILPKTQKCSVMHGHTSSMMVEISGHPIDGMVVDFGIAKEVIRDAARGLDHKLFIKKDYVVERTAKSVRMRFQTVHGPFSIEAPTPTTVLLDGEATVENLAAEALRRIAPRMPANVDSVGVYVYEGLNKGSYLLARLHEEEADGGRNRR